MSSFRRVYVAGAALGMLLLAVVTMNAGTSYAPEDFNRLVDRLFAEYYLPANPTAATAAGFHQYDSQLEDYAKSTIEGRRVALRHFLGEFESYPADRLGPVASADRDMVIANIKATLLNLEEIRMWEKNPDQYSGGASNAVFVIMSRNYAPQAERLKSVIARETRIPRVLQEARENLKNPPRIYVEIAIRQLPGITDFFRSDVPKAFSEVQDPQLRDEFRKANDSAIRSLHEYAVYLEKELLPRANGDFRIGADTYRKKLLYEEMVDLPLDRLLELGYRNLRQNQEAFRQTAKKLSPDKSASEVLEELGADHPAPGQLLQSFRDVLGGLCDFIEGHHIVTIPSPVRPILEETPPFMRALTFASMDTPGPYEKVAKEAYFNVTLPEAGWSRKQVEEHMAAFNRGVIISTAIHEAYPGHYLQFLWVPSAPSKVRKLLGAGANVEGWAHYTEQMMLDEGYGNGDLKLRLGQLQDALLRNARYIVGLELHTGKMTYEQGVDFFEKEGFQTRANAERETSRGTSDPTYLIYTLGKLQILKLRDDYRKKQGGAFRLQEFHDRFLSQGYPPIRIIRKTMLGDDSPVL